MWVKPIIIGLFLVIMGHVSNHIVKLCEGSQVPPECANWNKDFIMEKSLFISGILLWCVMRCFRHYTAICML